MTQRPVGVGTAAAIVSGSVILSRLLGLGRETLLAALLGVTAEGDLYRYAFLLPDLLNYLLAGGFLSITLIPLLSRRLEEGNSEQAQFDFTAVFRWVSVAIVALTAGLFIFAEPVARIAFASIPETDLPEVVRLTRIVLPAQICFVLGSLFMAYQYVHRKFLIPALAPLIYNLGIIAGGLLVAGNTGDRADGFIWGALLGALAGTLLLQWLGAHRAGLRFARGPSQAVPAYFALALPLMIGQSVAVLDEQFPRIFGQLSEVGATSALSLARMLNMLPVGVIAQAAAVASYPFLARLVAAGDETETDRLTDRALRTATVASLFALALVIGAARPLVTLVYEWGRFESADSDLVAGLLIWFALAIPAWGIHQILSRWFYAHQRMWLPVVIGTAATAVAIPLALWFLDPGRSERHRGREHRGDVAIHPGSLRRLESRARVDRWQPLASLIARALVPTAAAALAIRWVTDRVGEAGPLQSLLACLLAALIGLVVFSVSGRPLRLVESTPAWWRAQN